VKVDLERLAAMMPRMPRRKTGRPPGRPKGSVGEPREVMTIRLRPDQREALERLAVKERADRGAARLDISAVLRRLLDKVLRLRPPKV
jgi:hypothetical protein